MHFPILRTRDRKDKNPAVDISDFEGNSSIKDVVTLLEVDSEGNGGYDAENADKYGMVVLQKNQNGSYTLFTNLATDDILQLIQWTSVLASVNYYASAVAGTVMERGLDTSNQKAAVAGAVSMLFNNSVTEAVIGNNANIKTSGKTNIEATSQTNTRLLGGALSSSAAKAGVGLNVATAKQQDKVNAGIGNSATIDAESFQLNSVSVSDMLVITAAAVSAGGTSVGGALNVAINDTGAAATVGNDANISTDGNVDIRAESVADLILGSLSLAISGSTDAGAAVGAIVSVSSNDSYAKALVGDNAEIISDGAVNVAASSNEQVISVMAAAARSGNGGAGAGTVSVLTTDAKALAGIGDNAIITAADDISVTALSKARLIDIMLAAAASTDAPGVGATVMVNVFKRESGAFIGEGCTILSKNGSLILKADSSEDGFIISVAGAAASQAAISGNIQVNVGSSKTYATIGDDANIKVWDSVYLDAKQTGKAVSVAANASLSTGGTGGGATVQTTVLSSDIKAILGDNALIIAYAQDPVTSGASTGANRDGKRRGVILSALANDLVVSGGVSAAVAGGTGVSGVIETLVNRTSAIAKAGTNACITTGFKSGDTLDGAFTAGSASDKEGELSAEADSDSTLILFGGAFSATSSTGVGATVLTLVYDKNVQAEISLGKDEDKLSRINGSVNVKARAEDLVALVSVNFACPAAVLPMWAATCSYLRIP